VPEIANTEMATAWDGSEGDSWVEREEHHDLALAAHTRQLFAAAAVQPADRVLDVGCGCGSTTRDAARAAVDGHALGVDLSTAMLERARQRAREEGLRNVTFEHADAQVHPFDAARHDVLVSRFGAMFFGDPVAAFSNLARATAPGGRAVLLTWQELAHNEWLTAPRAAMAVGRTLPEPPVGAPGPFGLADRDQARAVLEQAGFGRVEFDDVEAPFVFGTDPDDAWAFIRNIPPVLGLLEGLDADDTARALDALRATIDSHTTPHGVVFGSRAWIIRAVR
jgi:SAM-dependent methyltransferase